MLFHTLYTIIDATVAGVATTIATTVAPIDCYNTAIVVVIVTININIYDAYGCK